MEDEDVELGLLQHVKDEEGKSGQEVDAESENNELEETEEKVKIFVELPTSKSIECYIDLHETTLDLKQKIWESYKGLILKNQRLIYRKQMMKDHLMLKTYCIDNGSRVTLCKRHWLTDFAARCKVKSECDCKFPTDRHPELTTMRRGENWSSDMHTAMEPCTSYGSYKSHKLGKSEFIRMADDTDPELVYDLVVASIRSIFGDNDTKDAKICYISVIGGNDNVTFSGKINKSLKKIGKMSDKDFLFIDGRTRTITSEIISAKGIGFVPWGSIKVRESLLGWFGRESQVDQSDRSHIDTSREVLLTEEPGLAILVDDGSVNRFGVERLLRGKIEKKIAESSKAPLVMLLICGGYSSVEMVWRGLCESPKVPLIIVKGSGGSADLLAEVLEKRQMLGRDSLKIIHSKARQLLKKHPLSEEKLKQYERMVMQCTEHHHDLIFVYDPSKEELSRSFVKAIFRSFQHRASGIFGFIAGKVINKINSDHPKWKTEQNEEKEFTKSIQSILRVASSVRSRWST